MPGYSSPSLWPSRSMGLYELIWRDFAAKTARAVEASAADVFTSPLLDSLEKRPKWFGKVRSRQPFKNSKVPLENSVTQAICERLEEVQSAQAITGYRDARYPDISEMSFAVEQPPPRRAVNYVPPIGDASDRNDLRLWIAKGQLDMRMEAKVILDLKSLKDTYLGAAGVKRFDDQEVPYTTMPFGMMIGYVVDQNDRDWLDILRGAVRDQALYHHETSMFGNSDRFTTRHSLPSGCRATHVEVIHLIAEITARPDARPSI